MEYDNKAYGAALKLARQKAKLKIGDIAQAFGVDEVYFSAVENGQRA